jgi:hypothetical protein
MKSEFATEIIEPAFSSIKDVYKLFVKDESPLSPLSPLVTHSESTVFEPKKFLTFFFKNNESQTSFNSEIQKIVIDQELDSEIDIYKNLIAEKNFWNGFELLYKSSSEFWINSQIQKQMPKLSQLFFILNTIPATSAAIERFFSIAGIVNDKRRLRMRDDLVIQRTMIKSNMELLENSSKKFV